jgi:hypothetical protein
MRLSLLAMLLFCQYTHAQEVKMFTKTVNFFVKVDLTLNPIGPYTTVNARADFYWNKSTSSGVVKINDLAHGKIYKYPVDEMYTGFAKGYKVYYFQTSDGQYKISVTKEENGFAMASYSDRTVTVYGNK